MAHLPGAPSGFFVNDIKVDLHDADTVYVAVDNRKSGDFSPYVLKSGDRGRTWSSISGDLPERHLVWRLVQNHVDPNLLFVGTEFGVFFSVEGGGKWIKLDAGMPNIPVRDLAIQKRENDLVAATFGRSFYILDDYSSLRSAQRMLHNQAGNGSEVAVVRPNLDGPVVECCQSDLKVEDSDPAHSAIYCNLEKSLSETWARPPEPSSAIFD